MLDELKSTFSLAICFALAGGLLGSLFITFGQHREIRIMSLLMVILSVVISATLADYMFPPKPWLYAGVGVFVGMISSALLDAFKGGYSAATWLHHRTHEEIASRWIATEGEGQTVCLPLHYPRVNTSRF